MFENRFSERMAALLDEYYNWSRYSDQEKREKQIAFRQKGAAFVEFLILMEEADMFRHLREILLEDAQDVADALTLAGLPDCASLFISFYKHRDGVPVGKLWPDGEAFDDGNGQS